MGDQDLQVILWLIGVALAIVAFIAQLRLFSIDKSLKQILSELEKRNDKS